MHTPEWLLATETLPTETGTRGERLSLPAADQDWTALLTNVALRPTSGSFFVTIINPTAGVITYGMAAAGQTAVATNGFPVGAGQTKRVFVSLPKHQKIAASAVGSFMYISSYDTDLVPA